MLVGAQVQRTTIHAQRVLRISGASSHAEKQNGKRVQCRRDFRRPLMRENFQRKKTAQPMPKPWCPPSCLPTMLELWCAWARVRVHQLRLRACVPRTCDVVLVFDLPSLDLDLASWFGGPLFVLDILCLTPSLPRVRWRNVGDSVFTVCHRTVRETLSATLARDVRELGSGCARGRLRRRRHLVPMKILSMPVNNVTEIITSTPTHHTQQTHTLHYTTQQYTALDDTLHDPTRTTRHYTTPHHTTPPYTTLHYTTLHHNAQHNTTQHIPIPPPPHSHPTLPPPPLHTSNSHSPTPTTSCKVKKLESLKKLKNVENV